jgi:hypothetical protein
MERSLQNITSSFTSGKKLHAFTLLELMAGMIASGIVITAIWTALHFVGARMQVNADAGRAGEEASLFYRVFAMEYERARTIIAEEDRVTFADSVSGKTICYSFYEDMVVRNDFIRTDTFIVAVRGLQSETAGEEESKFLERISFTMVNGNSTQDVFLQRSHTAVSIVRAHDRSFTTQ